MKCNFNADGICQGKYKGFGCIEDKCELFAKECPHWINDYCKKYGRFYCVESGNCSTFEEYLSHLENSKVK